MLLYSLVFSNPSHLLMTVPLNSVFLRFNAQYIMQYTLCCQCEKGYAVCHCPQLQIKSKTNFLRKMDIKYLRIELAPDSISVILLSFIYHWLYCCSSTLSDIYYKCLVTDCSIQTHSFWKLSPDVGELEDLVLGIYQLYGRHWTFISLHNKVWILSLININKYN